MTLEKALITHMLANTEIRPILGSRIFGGMVPIESVLPALGFMLNSEGRIRSLNDGNVISADLHFNFWAKRLPNGYTTVVDLAEKLAKSYDRKRQFLTGVEVLGMFLQNESDIQDDEAKAVGRLQVYNIIYIES
jgi:hypothetical protein